jgi:hypothetical protein
MPAAHCPACASRGVPDCGFHWSLAGRRTSVSKWDTLEGVKTMPSMFVWEPLDPQRLGATTDTALSTLSTLGASCLALDPAARPSFSELEQQLRALAEQAAEEAGY